jgi:UDP-N-acetylmuramoyl-tripeptide--D-alanyl-D-alanine ligase
MFWQTGNYNPTLGVVRTIRERLRPTHQVFVCEMGARNIGDIKEICELVHPGMGIITSIGPCHLESFKTIENVLKTKFELIDALPEGGTAFLNMDNSYIAEKRLM